MAVSEFLHAWEAFVSQLKLTPGRRGHNAYNMYDNFISIDILGHLNTREYLSLIQEEV